MNCYDHPTQIAVAQCIDCGKGLCPQCATMYSISICNTCNKQRINKEKRTIIKSWLLTFVLGLVVMFVSGIFLFAPGAEHKFRYFGYPMLLWISFGMVPGWRALNRITPNIFLILPLLGWVFYFVVKFLLALAIGCIILPFKLIKDVVRFIQLGKMSHNLN